MAKTVSSLAELDKEVRRRIDVALNGEVKNVVEDCMKDHIQRDVFAAYTPKVYERRGDSGIEGEGNIESTVKDGLLTVKNVAKLEGPRVPGARRRKPGLRSFWKDRAKALRIFGDLHQVQDI